MDTEPERYHGTFCGACGVVISAESDLQFYRPYATHSLDPILWINTYRAIIQQHEKHAHHKRYHLSGVGRLDFPMFPRHSIGNSSYWELTFSVPWDKDGFATERSPLCEDLKLQAERTDVYRANFWDYRNRDRYPHGFPIHAHCWSLIKRIIGPIAETELDHFIRVLLWRWKDEPFEVSKCIEDGYWGGKNFWRRLANRYHAANLPETANAIWDPITIPEVQALLRRGLHQESSKKRMTRQGRASSRLRGPLNLPLDIVYKILDYFPAAEIESILATTCWHVTDSYWRCRFPRKLIFEVEEFNLIETENVDWQFLCLEIEKLLENKSVHGLQNRQRIFRILEGTKKLFFSSLENGLED